jgi:glucose/arabinose dehydrogenase
MFALLIAGALAATPAAAPEPSATTTPAPAFVTSGTPSPSPSPSASSVCETLKVAPLDTLDSKTAQPGQAFHFKVAGIESADGTFPKVSTGADGVAVISVVRRGSMGGAPGLLVLETRYVVASDGTHVPAVLVRKVSGLFMGKSHNSPPGVGWLPFVGYAAGAYDALHKGGDVSFGPNDQLTVALGDDAVTGACSIPSPKPH